MYEVNVVEDLCVSYFDGASLHGLGSCGMVIIIDSIHWYHLHMGCGIGTNKREKMMALWGLLWFATNRNIVALYVLRDSRIIIDLENEKSHLQVVVLGLWCSKLRILHKSFMFLSF